jgi:hypothetical protein
MYFARTRLRKDAMHTCDITARPPFFYCKNLKTCQLAVLLFVVFIVTYETTLCRWQARAFAVAAPGQVASVVTPAAAISTTTAATAAASSTDAASAPGGPIAAVTRLAQSMGVDLNRLEVHIDVLASLPQEIQLQILNLALAQARGEHEDEDDEEEEEEEDEDDDMEEEESDIDEVTQFNVDGEPMFLGDDHDESDDVDHMVAGGYIPTAVTVAATAAGGCVSTSPAMAVQAAGPTVLDNWMLGNFALISSLRKNTSLLFFQLFIDSHFKEFFTAGTYRAAQF